MAPIHNKSFQDTIQVNKKLCSCHKSNSNPITVKLHFSFSQRVHCKSQLVNVININKSESSLCCCRSCWASMLVTVYRNNSSLKILNLQQVQAQDDQSYLSSSWGLRRLGRGDRRIVALWEENHKLNALMATCTNMERKDKDGCRVRTFDKNIIQKS